MIRNGKAPRPVAADPSRGLRLTVVFEFVGHTSVEAGQKFAERWMLDKTGMQADGIRAVSVRGEDADITAATPGERVRRRRIRLALTQQQLGELAGVSHTTVAHVEAGRTDHFGPDTRQAILDALTNAEVGR
jgi:DNA-binding transcriptional regulator YiaG